MMIIRVSLHPFNTAYVLLLVLLAAGNNNYTILIIATSGKNHFYKMNGDVGMVGW